MSNHLPCPKCGSAPEEDQFPNGTLKLWCSNPDCEIKDFWSPPAFWNSVDRTKPSNIQDVYKQFELSLRAIKEEKDALKEQVKILVEAAPTQLRNDPLQDFSNNWRPFATQFRAFQKWMDRHE